MDLEVGLDLGLGLRRLCDGFATALRRLCDGFASGGVYLYDDMALRMCASGE